MSAEETDAVFEMASTLSQFAQRQDERRRLRERINDMTMRCGGCIHWMHKECPQERNINGRNRGPSIASPKCFKFEMSARTQKECRELEAKLAPITSTRASGESQP